MNARTFLKVHVFRDLLANEERLRQLAEARTLRLDAETREAESRTRLVRAMYELAAELRGVPARLAPRQPVQQRDPEDRRKRITLAPPLPDTRPAIVAAIAAPSGDVIATVEAETEGITTEEAIQALLSLGYRAADARRAWAEAAQEQTTPQERMACALRSLDGKR